MEVVQMPIRARVGALLAVTALSAVAAPSALAAGTPAAKRQFVSTAVELPGDIVQLPLQRGTSGGRSVYYVVLESSDGVQKLDNARGTDAVQKVTVNDGVVDFPATVDFSAQRDIVPGPAGFPPDLAMPGAIGAPGYSPLIELPDGTVLNAPQIANDTGRADKVVAMDTAAGTVDYRETNGESRTHAVRYASFDASNPVAAALENATYAPALNAAPSVDGDGTDSARASLAAIVNGATGAGNPQHQGLNSAILDGLDPLNILRWLPQQGRYSPLWDVHLAAWAITPRRLTQYDDVADLARAGDVTGPGGAPFGATGFIVNCPIIALVT
jgi:hypothetical protein